MIETRPWRNRNPGDLRTLPHGQRWAGQTDIDTAPGGPFAVFGLEQDGWGALATCLLAYQDIHGLHTVRGMIGRFAPALENDTGGYVSLVCRKIGVRPDDTVSAHAYATMLALCSAIALAEGGASLPWGDGARTSGIVGALARGGRGVQPPAPMNPGVPAAPSAADALNAAELAGWGLLAG